jgi:hypothetical protein
MKTQRRKRLKLIKSEATKEEITTNFNKIQRIIRDYFKNLYSSKLENLNKMGKFLDVYNQ